MFWIRYRTIIEDKFCKTKKGFSIMWAFYDDSPFTTFFIYTFALNPVNGEGNFALQQKKKWMWRPSNLPWALLLPSLSSKRRVWENPACKYNPKYQIYCFQNIKDPKKGTRCRWGLSWMFWMWCPSSATFPFSFYPVMRLRRNELKESVCNSLPCLVQILSM